MTVFDARRCVLGEGPLWHPERQQLFWFDIMDHKMLSRVGDTALTWEFGECVSAAGWLDTDRLLIASETALFAFDLSTDTSEYVQALEAENAVTRSNDGRADPWGGFWIGTMGKHAEPQAGAIYRFYRGELRQIASDISIANAICFAPDRSVAYYTDTITGQVLRVPLHPDTGWPNGDAVVHLDLKSDGLNPDGAVTDAVGNLWVAQWGAARVACYAPDGAFLKAVPVDAEQASCPAFGGADLTDLYVTTAAVNTSEASRARYAGTGQTFCIAAAGQGLPEPRVIL